MPNTINVNQACHLDLIYLLVLTVPFPSTLKYIVLASSGVLFFLIAFIYSIFDMTCIVPCALLLILSSS